MVYRCIGAPDVPAPEDIVIVINGGDKGVTLFTAGGDADLLCITQVFYILNNIIRCLPYKACVGRVDVHICGVEVGCIDNTCAAVAYNICQNGISAGVGYYV